MDRPAMYVLIGQTPVPEPDIEKWARWMQTGASVVSTVFLGLDHRFGLGPPLLFETMIFSHGSFGEDFQEREIEEQASRRGRENH